MNSIRNMRRVNFGYFVRPPEETGTGQPRVEPVLGYLVPHADRWLLFDSGIGSGHEDLDAHYRPARRSLRAALDAAGVALDDIGWVANCHLHFDHSGGNPTLADRPIFVQRTELATARDRDDYTLPELVADDIGYQVVDGDIELFPGVFLLRTPGHVEGHQSLVVRCQDGTVICAGQSHDSASLFTADMLAHQARADGVVEPLPPVPPWLGSMARFDPSRVVFAHDLSVWEPADPD